MIPTVNYVKMDNNTQAENLCKQIEGLSKTSLELLKYKSISTFSKILSSLMVFTIIFLFALFSLVFAGISLAYWIGCCVGNSYYGFIIVAVLFIVIAIILYFLRNRSIKNLVHNYFIRLLQRV